MSCRCGCGSCGVGNLAFSILPGGLRGLGEIRAGSQIRVGFRFSERLFDSSLSARDVEQTVEGCLYGTGAFDTVSAKAEIGFLTNYITVRASLNASFANPDDIGELIESRIRECYPDLGNQIDNRDPVLIDAIPQGVSVDTVPVANRPPAPGQQQSSSSNSLLSLVGLGGGSSNSSSTTALILAIGLAVVIAKAVK